MHRFEPLPAARNSATCSSTSQNPEIRPLLPIVMRTRHHKVAAEKGQNPRYHSTQANSGYHECELMIRSVCFGVPMDAQHLGERCTPHRIGNLDHGPRDSA